MGNGKENPAYQKAYALAIQIVKIYRQLTEKRREYVISKQLLKSGTSIGANLAEANGAISEADLSAKVSIAYKETQETKYWPSLLKDSGYLEEKIYCKMYAEVNELGGILFAIIRKMRFPA